MAGAGWKQWTRERLSVSDLQQFIQDQVVARWPSASAGNAGLAAPSVGMIRTLDDTGQVQRYYGATVGWRDLAPGTCYGKMWRSSGTSGAGTASLAQASETVVVMDEGRVAGGFTFDNAADTLTIPVDGLYDVRGAAHGLGGSFDAWQQNWWVKRIRAATADRILVSHMLYKHTGQEEFATFATPGPVPLKAGDKLALSVYPYQTGSFYYGGSETSGVGCGAEYLAPLNGVTPV